MLPPDDINKNFNDICYAIAKQIARGIVLLSQHKDNYQIVRIIRGVQRDITNLVNKVAITYIPYRNQIRYLVYDINLLRNGNITLAEHLQKAEQKLREN